MWFHLELLSVVNLIFRKRELSDEKKYYVFFFAFQTKLQLIFRPILTPNLTLKQFLLKAFLFVPTIKNGKELCIRVCFSIFFSF